MEKGRMSGDLISRETVVEALRARERELREVGMSYSVVALICVNIVKDVPAVDAEPVRHGKWVHLGGDEWCCTGCGEVIHTEGSWEQPTKKFCHECGAKMDKEGEK